MNVGYKQFKTHNKLFFDASETNYMNKCIATALINFNPAHYEFDMTKSVNYNPVQLTHVSDNLTIGAIPVWDANEPLKLIREPRPSDKFEIILLDDKAISNFKAPPSIIGWPLLYIKSSCGIDIDLLPTEDCFTVDRQGYAHITNYGDVIEKNAPVEIRTKFTPPSGKDYFVRAIDKLGEVLNDYLETPEGSLMRIQSEHLFIHSMVNFITDGDSLRYMKLSVDDSPSVVTKTGVPIYLNALETLMENLGSSIITLEGEKYKEYAFS